MDSEEPDVEKKLDFNDSGCVQDTSMNDGGYKGQAHLLDLSDDVLLLILQHCTPQSLKALGHTCPRLGALICDRTLWTRVNGSSLPTGQERLKWMLTHGLNTATTDLKLRGYVNKRLKCLGIQEPVLPRGPEAEISAYVRGTLVGAPMVDEHFMLRMWCPPRFAASPYWPENPGQSSSQRNPSWVPPIHGPSSSGLNKEPNTSKNNGNGVKNSTKADNSNGRTQSNCYQNSTEVNKGSIEVNKKSTEVNKGSIEVNKRSTEVNKSSIKVDKDSIEVNKKSIEVNKDSNKVDPPAPKKIKTFKEQCDELIASCTGPQFTVTSQILRELRAKCPNLTTLYLEYCDIDYKTTNIRLFPTKLKKLSLRGSRCFNLPHPASYLCRIHDRMPDLEYLDVSECDWFEPANLMPISKIPKLSALYMRQCQRLTECVAYASLATRYGFRELKKLDLRDTLLADSEISALGWLPKLEELHVSPLAEEESYTEHTHKWLDEIAPFQELEDWELEVPEYYKNKSDFSEDVADDEEDLREDPNISVYNEMRRDNAWYSQERRIIVIQPSHDQPRTQPNELINLVVPNVPGADIEPLVPINLSPDRRDRNLRRNREDDEEDSSKRQKLEDGDGKSNKNTDLRPSTSQFDDSKPGCSKSGMTEPNMADGKRKIKKDPDDNDKSKRKMGDDNDKKDSDDDDDEPQTKYVKITRRFCPSSDKIHVTVSDPTISSNKTCNRNTQSTQTSENMSDNSESSNQIPDASKNPNATENQDNQIQYMTFKKRFAITDRPSGSNPLLQSPNLLNWISIEPTASSSSNYVNFKRAFEQNPENLRIMRDDMNPYLNVNAPPQEPAIAPVDLCNRRKSAEESEPEPIQDDKNIQEDQISEEEFEPEDDNAGYVLEDFLPAEGHPDPVGAVQDFAENALKDIFYGPDNINNLPEDADEPDNVENQQEDEINEVKDAEDSSDDDAEEDQEFRNIQKLIAASAPRAPQLEPDLDLNDLAPRPFADIAFNSRNFGPPPNMQPNVAFNDNMNNIVYGFSNQILAHNLVTDSAILRFGMADNDNINYVHIGRNGGHANEPGMRPDRSNLRVLSIRGYSHVTDRSLTHLATAAPHLRHVDLSGTSVTPKGIEVFRSIRPDVELVYNVW